MNIEILTDPAYPSDKGLVIKTDQGLIFTRANDKDFISQLVFAEAIADALQTTQSNG